MFGLEYASALAYIPDQQDSVFTHGMMGMSCLWDTSWLSWQKPVLVVLQIDDFTEDAR